MVLSSLALSAFLEQIIPDVTLCEEAVYQSLSSLHLSSVPLERLLENLPGRKVDHKSLERLKKACTPQQQVLQLLRLWREQNKDHDKLYGIIQGTNMHCTLTLQHSFIKCCLWVPMFAPCPSRCEPLWEESLTLQQPKKPDHRWSPDSHQQPAGGQSSAGGCPGRGIYLHAQTVHPATFSPLEDSKLWLGSSKRSDPQS